MSKDPAFLFYPNDWLGGTIGMTFEEKGAYMELLMMQFNRGHMTSHMIGQTVGHIWDNLKDKFDIDSDGKFFNKRLDEEKNKRKRITESRRNNIEGKNQYKKEEKNNGHMTSHMENENEDVNISLNNKNNIDKNIYKNLPFEISIPDNAKPLEEAEYKHWNIDIEKDIDFDVENHSLKVRDTVYTFEAFFEQYNNQKDKLKSKEVWNTLTKEEMTFCFIRTPIYVKTVTDRKFMFSPLNYLAGRKFMIDHRSKLDSTKYDLNTGQTKFVM